MSGLSCPKCGTRNADDAVICAGCDFILDSSFLGEDILDQPTRDDSNLPPPTVEGGGFGAPAVILGRVRKRHDEFESFMSPKTGSFLTESTNDVERVMEPAPVYMLKSTQALLESNAVLGLRPDIDVPSLSLSPFELHVLSFIDGKRPVARIRKKSGLSLSDVKIALAMIADRGVLELVGTVQMPSLGAVVRDALESREQSAEAPAARDPSEMEQAPEDLPSAEAEEIVSDEFNELTLPLPPESDEGFAVATVPHVRRHNALVDALRSSLPSTTGGAPREVTATRRVPAPVSDPAHRSAPPSLDEIPPAVGRVPADISFLPEARTLPLRAHAPAALSLEQAAQARREGQRLFAAAQDAELAGDVEHAVGFLEDAIALNPDAAELHNRLGVILATRGLDLPRAVSLLQRAVELDGHNGVYRSNLGKVMRMSELAPDEVSDALGGGVVDGPTEAHDTLGDGRHPILGRLREDDEG